MDKVAMVARRSPEPGIRTGKATKDRVRRVLKTKVRRESKRELMASLGLVRVVGARGGVYYE